MKYLLIVLLLFASCGSPSAPTVPTSTTVTTSAGIRVTSASTLSLGHLTEIDNQYDELLRIAAAPPNNYVVYPAPQDIQIFTVARDMRCRQISFVVAQNVPKGTNYDGTEFDLDGKTDGKIEICAAGRHVISRAIGYGQCQPGGDSIEVTADGIIQTDIVRYELEHWLLYRIDCPRFWQTMSHTSVQGHPILGDGGIQKVRRMVRLDQMLETPTLGSTAPYNKALASPSASVIQ